MSSPNQIPNVNALCIPALIFKLHVFKFKQNNLICIHQEHKKAKSVEFSFREYLAKN